VAILGRVPADYACALALLGAAGTLAGQTGVDWALKKFKKDAVVRRAPLRRLQRFAFTTQTKLRQLEQRYLSELSLRHPRFVKYSPFFSLACASTPIAGGFVDGGHHDSRAGAHDWRRSRQPPRGRTHGFWRTLLSAALLTTTVK
jgi:hypothetical protein